VSGPVDGPVAAGLKVSYLIGSTAGGTGRHVAMLAAGCAARGAAVTVYGPSAALQAMSADGRAWDRTGVRFAAVDIAGRPRPARDAAAVLRLRRLLARDLPDVLHAHGLRAGALASLALSGPAGRSTALAVTVHNAPPPGQPAATVYAFLELLVARRAGAVLTVSGDLAARMRRRGARLAGRALVPAPAAGAPAPADVAAVREELGAAGRPLVLAVGRLAPQKGFSTLIEAASRWQRPGGGRPEAASPGAGAASQGSGAASPGPPRVTGPRSAAALLVIAGQGPLQAALRSQAETAGVAARFPGQRQDVPALLAAADVVAVPSAWEGQPLIVQEALRAGRPLVASRVGGIPDLTGPDGAVLVPPGEPGVLAAAVTRLLDDEPAAAAQAASALARAALLPTEEAALEQVLRLYHQLCRPASPLADPGPRSDPPGQLPNQG
jgi:glycosyltransferase involved in cell wall biosynthesis